MHMSSTNEGCSNRVDACIRIPSIAQSHHRLFLGSTFYQRQSNATTAQRPRLRSLPPPHHKDIQNKLRRACATRLVPYASMLDIESSTCAKPLHSAFYSRQNFKLVDLRNSKSFYLLSSTVERPELSTKAGVRQSLHSPYCIWSGCQGNGTRMHGPKRARRVTTPYPLVTISSFAG